MYIPSIAELGTNSDRLLPFVWYKGDAMLHWDRYEHLVVDSVAHSKGTLTVAGVAEALQNGSACAMGTERNGEVVMILVARIVEYETFNSARIVAMAGRNLREAHKFMHLLEEWAFAQGAVELEGWCRPAVQRLLQRMGWKHKFSIMTYDLRRRLQ